MARRRRRRGPSTIGVLFWTSLAGFSLLLTCGLLYIYVVGGEFLDIPLIQPPPPPTVGITNFDAEFQAAVTQDEINYYQSLAGGNGFAAPFFGPDCKNRGYSAETISNTAVVAQIAEDLRAQGLQFDRLLWVTHMLCEGDTIVIVDGVFVNLQRGSSPYVMWTYEGQLNETCKKQPQAEVTYVQHWACREYSGYTGIAMLSVYSSSSTN